MRKRSGFLHILNKPPEGANRLSLCAYRLSQQREKLLFGGLNVPGIDAHRPCPPCVKGGRGDWAVGTDDLQPASANS